ncbi:hypothetical protein SAMN05216338_1003300 [Bradyrhizobium sp. Rc2d]|nr:hypothetical protein SAMN05216338_1003300 [Bradyrhizobium sp. Rc2d]
MESVAMANEQDVFGRIDEIELNEAAAVIVE